MSTELRRNSSPPFETGGLVFECFVDGNRDYQWLSKCRRARCWREGRNYWAEVQNIRGPRPAKSLMEAMTVAVNQLHRMRAA